SGNATASAATAMTTRSLPAPRRLPVGSRSSYVGLFHFGLRLALFRWHLQDAQAVVAVHAHLFCRILIFRFAAPAMRKRDRRDDRHQTDHGRDFERKRVIGVNLQAERRGLAAAGQRRRARPAALDARAT